MGMIFGKHVSSNFIKESSKTHQNSVPGALGVLKNDSSCSFPTWGWSQSIFWMDKWCFKIKTCAKMTLKKTRFLTRSVWKFRNQDFLPKMSSILCRRRLFAKKMFKKPWQIWEFLENYDKPLQKYHIFFAAGAFSQNL